jgi:hypothetical protein
MLVELIGLAGENQLAQLFLDPNSVPRDDTKQGSRMNFRSARPTVE